MAVVNVKPVSSSADHSKPEVITFVPGERFECFEELEAKLKQYEMATYTQWWKRDCRTVDTARRRLDRPLSDKIRYYQVVFKCINGGRKFKSKGAGIRSTMTFRQDCPAELSLIASADGSGLVVKKFSDKHNHVVNKQLLLPKQRKLSDSEKEEAKALLELQCNKKLLQNKLSSVSRKTVLLKDLSNLKTKMDKEKTRNNLEASVKSLIEKHGASVHVLVNDSNTFQGVYFQDTQMKQSFSAYPEFLCVDATYKLLELRLSLYIFLVEDGNGDSEVAAAFLLLEENESSLSNDSRIFKSENPAWERVRVIMTDKDMTERHVFTSQFPKAHMLICLFHTFRSFRREITTEKMGITSGQRTLYLELLQQMAYATNEEKYNEVYTRFKESTSSTVIQYFVENWHPIRSQWTLGMKYSSGNFLNNTNNRLESLNSKLKSVVSRYSSLEEFIEKVFLTLSVLRSERDHRAGFTVQKVPVLPESTDPGLIKYMSHLTHYAYQFVSKQVSLKDKVEIVSVSDQECVKSKAEGELTVTPTFCQCMQWQSMRLPCRHIIAVRIHAKMDIYEASLCDKRWTLEYYKASQRVFLGDGKEQSFDCSVIVCSPQKKKVLSQVSQFEKFRRVSKITTKLASLASEAIGSEFEERCNYLEKIVASWEKGESLSMLNEVTERKDCFKDTNDTCDETEDVGQSSDKQNHLEKISSRELMNGLTTPFPRFVTLNSDMPDLSIPELQKKVYDEDALTQGKQSQPLADATNKGNPILKDITLPTKLKKRGRPKGHELTVIGLPTKRRKCSENKVLPFIKLHTHLKQKVMLEWFVPKDVATYALSSPKNLIGEDSVETKPELLHEGVLDENVDIHLIRSFFTTDAWLCVTNVVQQKQKTHVYFCNCCHQDLESFQSIGCDHCLRWSHLKCYGLKDRPKTRYWFCRNCHTSPILCH